MTFTELGIIDPIARAVEELGYTEPMPVQERVIPLLLGTPQDMVALAQTGTGKTAAYGLPILQSLTPKGKTIETLVLTPTRELCIQIADDLTQYSRYLPYMPPLAVYGGASIDQQIRHLRKHPKVLVATPGRMLDLIRRGEADLSSVRTVVLDEADIMLDMGFRDDLQEILSRIPDERHLLLFSATMSKGVKEIAAGYLRNPQEIQIGRSNQTNVNIKHRYCTVPAKHKYTALKRLVDFYPGVYGIVFCRTRAETKEIAEKLIQDGYNADALHGDLSQAQRDMVMNRFRIRNLQLLIATDVAARGLDVNNLTHVIHYGLPDDLEAYTHRSGRTARAGKTGYSIAICHLREKSRLRTIEKVTGATIERIPLPDGEAVCAKQLFSLADKIEQIDVEDLQDDPTETPAQGAKLRELLKLICAKLSWLDKEEIIRRVMLLEFNRLLNYYESAEEIDFDEPDQHKERPQRKERQTGGSKSEEGMTRLFINLGKRDSLFPNKLIELVNRCVPGRVDIGKIDLMQSFSFFDVEQARAKEVVECLSEYEVQGRRIAVSYADEPATNPRKRREKRSETSGHGRADARGDRGRGTDDTLESKSRKGDGKTGKDYGKGKPKSRR